MSSVAISELDRLVIKLASKKDLQQKDLDLWHQWKDGGEQHKDMRPLLSQFRGMIHKNARVWRGIDMPEAVIHAEHNKAFLTAVRSFDPEKGKLGTWIHKNLRLAPQRFLTTYQNPARIVETRTGHQRGLFNKAISTLDEQLGREPTTQEVSEYMGWSEPEVARAQAENRGAFYTSVNKYGMDPQTNMPSRASEVARFIKAELTSEELIVWEYTTGTGGKPQLRAGEIAKVMKTNPSKISRLRNSISEKIKKYY